MQLVVISRRSPGLEGHYSNVMGNLVLGGGGGREGGVLSQGRCRGVHYFSTVADRRYVVGG